ncbi:MAG: methyltransferase domain-containing protein [Bdellovibrionaceae bacterium]|nr:methyltransferase domain-containing protein [Bdellovibrionales bacterium]MCB9082703.1 methyltransferase domain-containing protein [Pseudobdellovibrionaceae bacterium]
MEDRTYQIEAQVESDHWWFRARRDLIAGYLHQLNLNDQTEILDVGSSTGTNLRLLQEMGFQKYQGVDTSQSSVDWCREKKLGFVSLGDAQDLPFAEAAFDVVLATDVLEHLGDDLKGAQELYRVLRPGGWALVTVPTFQSLWGKQDEVSLHKRRYRLSQVAKICLQAGFEVREKYYFNFLLFAPIWLARQVLKRIPNRIESENQVNTPLMNKVLYRVFSFDLSVAPWIKAPVGVSAFLLLQKPQK